MSQVRYSIMDGLPAPDSEVVPGLGVASRPRLGCGERAPVRLHPPTVSVCIPTCERRVLLSECLESVLGQDYDDFELVVIDDASTDDTYSYLGSVGDPRVRVLRNSTRLGPAANYDKCLAEARGRYVKVMSDDDLLASDCLSRQVSVLQDDSNVGVSLVASRRWVIDVKGRRIMSRGSRRRGRIPGGEAIRSAVRSGTNPFGEPSAVLFRADQARETGGFGAPEHYALDLGLWLRLLLLGDLYMMPERLASFRVSPLSWSVVNRRVQSAQFAEFARSLGRDWRFGLSSADVRTAVRASRRQARLRGLFYGLVAATSGRAAR